MRVRPFSYGRPVPFRRNQRTRENVTLASIFPASAIAIRNAGTAHGSAVYPGAAIPYLVISRECIRMPNGLPMAPEEADASGLRPVRCANGSLPPVARFRACGYRRTTTF